MLENGKEMPCIRPYILSDTAYSILSLLLEEQFIVFPVMALNQKDMWTSAFGIMFQQ